MSRDIAEWKKVEEELLNEKKFTEAAINAQRDTFFVFDPSTSKAIRWNKAFSEISGYTNEEIANMKAPESYYSELDLKTSAKAIEKIDNKGTALLEMNLITKNGKAIPFEYLGTSINDEEGNTKYIVSIGRDITERRRSEEALHYERDLIRTLLENHPDFIYFKDSKARFQRISKRFCELFGRNIEDIIGKTDLELFPEEIAKQTYREDIHVIATGLPIINKEENAAGTWVLTTKIPWVDKEGNMRGLFGISRDITERKKADQKLKESENKFRELFNNMKSGVAVYEAIDNGEDFIFKDFNLAGEKIDNIKKKDLIDKKITHVFPGVTQFGLLEVFQRVFKTGKPEHHPISQYQDDRITGWRDNYVYKLPSGEIVTVYEDLTEKKKSEETLIESEEKFRNITEQSLMGICIVQDNKIQYINEAYSNIFGYTVEEMMKWELKDASNAIYPDDREFTLKQLAKKQRGDKDIVEHYQYRGIKKSGKIIWVDQYSKTFIYRGKPANFITIIDINERKKAEQRLHESEKRLKEERDNLLNMLNSMEDGVYIINQHYEIEFVNPSLKNAFGPIENKKCYEYFQNISEPCSWCKTQEKVTHGSIRWEWDSLITKKFYEIIATPIKRADGQFSKLVIFHDITKRKKAVSKLKKSREQSDMYLNLAGVILVALNRDGIITLMNKKGYEILKYEEGFLDGQNWFEKCLPEKIKDEVYKIFTGLMNGDLESFEYAEGDVITKNGKIKTIAWHNTILYDKYGNINGTLSSGEDITEHKKVEKELKRLSKLKSELLTRTSHELKTPAMHIKGYVDLLLHKYKNNFGIEELQIISHIKKGCLRLETLIYDIMHKAELDSGQGELNKAKNDLSSLIELSVRELNSFAALRGHSIILDIHDSMIINFDKEQIRHVINNIMTNAIKYTPLNGIIGINSTIEDDYITIAIQDNGIGFTEEQINRLFTQFGKIERYGQGFDIITEGSGLGLHITKKIIDLHGGKIWVESGGRNKGSTFYFSLPKVNI